MKGSRRSLLSLRRLYVSLYCGGKRRSGGGSLLVQLDVAVADVVVSGGVGSLSADHPCKKYT
eukprot:1194612-Prorocentrum_minimum.AAC.2